LASHILDADTFVRVLLATIRNLGAYPCPQCLVPKTKIPDLGTKLDDRNRVKTHRQDDAQHQWSIKRACELIYEKGKGVKSAVVERLLGAKSLVPTKVCGLYSTELGDEGRCPLARQNESQ